MIGQIDICGKDKEERAIERIKTFEDIAGESGYYLGFSGGKDSIVVYDLMRRAGVKFDAHMSLTSVDPPEVIRYVKRYYPDVSLDFPRYNDGERVTMWNLIPRKHYVPTRFARYCCGYLKEKHGYGRSCVFGIRWAESNARRGRGGLETGPGKRRIRLDPDNAHLEMVHACTTKSKNILNPIIDWSTADVWEYIHRYDIPYCDLYDEGFTRIGCVGCPMSGTKRKIDFERWPKFRAAYIRAFERMIFERQKIGLPCTWESGEDVMEWWLRDS